MPSLTFTEKMSLAAGSATLALAPAAADAALVTVTPTAGTVKISLAQAHNTIVSWDVDNTGADEFHLKIFKNAGAGPGYFYALSIIELNSHDNGVQLNGRGFVGVPFSSGYGPSPDDRIRVLGSSFNVGQTLASPYVFGKSNVDNVRKLLENSTYNGGVYRSGGNDVVNSLNNPVGDGNYFIGFAFDPGDGLHYGWATMGLDFTNESVEILNWTYNDVAGDPVHVGTEYTPPPPPPPPTPEVPVPATIVPALALLGMGAAGIRMQRRRKARAADAA